MAGFYTQRRDIPSVGSITGREDFPDGSLYRSLDVSRTGLQITKSFRTGKGESLVSPEELAGSNSYLNSLLETKEVQYDTGHAFETLKQEAFVSNQHVRRSGSEYLMNGSFPYVPQEWLGEHLAFPEIPKWTTANVDGNNAILKTYPTAPEASLSTAISELKRDGLPSLFGLQIQSMKGSAAKALGGELLNHQFGWVPLIADLDKLLKAVVRSSQIIQQFERDSGRLVRRRKSFPVLHEVVQSAKYNQEVYSWPNSGSPLYGKNGVYTIEKTRSTKIWFSGAYTYYLDPGKNLVGQAIRFEQLANHLLGIRLTPDVLWNLAPWSWLADWFANIGNNITVASAFQQDGLTLKYGYLMRKVIATDMYSFAADRPILGQLPVSRLLLRTTSKERVKSSPFGFGLSEADFTGRQWAIAGALGLSKSPRSMH